MDSDASENLAKIPEKWQFQLHHFNQKIHYDITYTSDQFLYRNVLITTIMSIEEFGVVLYSYKQKIIHLISSAVSQIFLCREFLSHGILQPTLNLETKTKYVLCSVNSLNRHSYI